MSHILIVGGTGMLRNVSLYFASDNHIVSVVARSKDRLEELKRETEGQINPIPVDYRNGVELRQKVQNAIDYYGSIDMAICWIDSAAPDAHRGVIKSLQSGNSKSKYYHILGSSYIKMLSDLPEYQNPLEKIDHILYRMIVLGAIFEDSSFRWLTNDEISSGVVDAIKKDQPYHVIGEIPYY